MSAKDAGGNNAVRYCPHGTDGESEGGGPHEQAGPGRGRMEVMPAWLRVKVSLLNHMDNTPAQKNLPRR